MATTPRRPLMETVNQRQGQDGAPNPSQAGPLGAPWWGVRLYGSFTQHSTIRNRENQIKLQARTPCLRYRSVLFQDLEKILQLYKMWPFLNNWAKLSNAATSQRPKPLHEKAPYQSQITSGQSQDKSSAIYMKLALVTAAEMNEGSVRGRSTAAFLVLLLHALFCQDMAVTNVTRVTRHDSGTKKAGVVRAGQEVATALTQGFTHARAVLGSDEDGSYEFGMKSSERLLWPSHRDLGLDGEDHPRLQRPAPVWRCRPVAPAVVAPAVMAPAVVAPAVLPDSTLPMHLRRDILLLGLSAGTT
ncbi:hypothetical protein P7K49_009222 [Saguinus oedipus]|uniref:Uncharacterized protein n=1 Tax=Saguinus oedipus TaxID=9490 RepID=A0ABQ9VJZ4_SAGOE|nr:hypothetical protein P7K49_009222 [Saguinus oedipus]